MSSSDPTATTRAALETTRVLYDIATLLNTGLDRETLSICISMCENNANPEALAAVIKELRSQSGRQPTS